MQLFIFIVGFFVTMLVAYGVIYGIFSQVPGEIKNPEEDDFRATPSQPSSPEKL